MTMNFIGKGTPITQADFDQAVASLGGDAATLWALFAVETRGFGFLPTRKPQILFERHVFHARTRGRLSKAHPEISNAAPGHYSGGEAEYGRLANAMALDETAALESASWGLGQVMGYNAQASGFTDVRAMVRAMIESEAAHLTATVRFMGARVALLNAYRGKVWDRIAFYYNGAGYQKNNYPERLRESYALFSTPARQPAISTAPPKPA